MNTASTLIKGKMLKVNYIAGTLLLLSATIIGCFTVSSDVERLSAGLLISAAIALIAARVLVDSLFKAVVFLFCFSLLEASFVTTCNLTFAPNIFTIPIAQVYFQALISNCIFGCAIGGLLYMFVEANTALKVMIPPIKAFMQQRKQREGN